MGSSILQQTFRESKKFPLKLTMLVPVVLLLLASGKATVQKSDVINDDKTIRYDKNNSCVYYPTVVETARLVHQVKKDHSTDEFPLTDDAMANTNFAWLKTRPCSWLENGSGGWKDNKIVEWEWHGDKIRSVAFPSHCWGLVKDLGHWKLWAMTPGNRSKFIMVPCENSDAAEFTVASGIHGPQLRIEEGNRPFCVENMHPIPQNGDVLQQRDRWLFMSRCTTGLF